MARRTLSSRVQPDLPRLGQRLVQKCPVAGQLRALGAEVVRAARRFRAEGTCDYADDRQFAADGRAAQPEAGPARRA